MIRGKKAAVPEQTITSSEVLLANQLFYDVRAKDYDAKNHVHSRAIQRHYLRLFERFVFAGFTKLDVRQWRVCDIGCGTGFLENLFADYFGCCYSLDATPSMLAVAKRKLAGKRIVWALADARLPPFRDQSFDLVCANAILHHVHDYRVVLSKMISLLKPGGRLFLGYEPNALPYRLFWPLIKLASKMIPEHRNREQIRKDSGQDRHGAFKDVYIHELAEYHIYQGHGIDPDDLSEFIRRQGMTNTRLHFSAVYQLALLRDSGVPLPLNLLPDWCFRLPGRLNLSFCLTAVKNE